MSEQGFVTQFYSAAPALNLFEQWEMPLLMASGSHTLQCILGVKLVRN